MTNPKPSTAQRREKIRAMSCRRTDLGPTTTLFTCGRSNSTRSPPCSNCKTAGAQHTCQFELAGSKAGQRCGRELCRKCVRRSLANQDLCAVHHRLVESRQDGRGAP